MDFNRFNRVYIDTKITSNYVDCQIEPASLLRKANTEKKLKKSADLIYCMYKTKYKLKGEEEEQDALIMAFSMELTGRLKGPISPIMSLVDFLYNHLVRIDYICYTREPILGTNMKQSIAFLKVIKIIREDDLL